MKIIFIEPKSPNLHIFSKFKIPRIGSVLLATIAREHGHDAEVFAEEIAPIDWEKVKEADIVGISTITSTAPRAYQISQKIMKMGIPVVLGGPHVTYMPKEAAHYCDYVLTGEAERTFVELLQYLEGQRDLDYVNNLVYLKNGQLVYNKKLNEAEDIRNNPVPDYSLVKDFYNTNAFIANKRVIPIQVSRGCPHDCTFCSVTGMFGRKMRYRNTEDVIEELQQYNDKKYHIFFYDDNFAANPKKAKELLAAMVKMKNKFNWSTQMRADAAKDEELLGLMKKSRCDTVYVGIESVDPDTLKQVKKRQDVEETRQNLINYKRFGINVHGMFILGFDGDKPDSWKTTVNFAKSAKISTIQALILTPLPGTQVYDEFVKNNRIIFKDWSLYDSHHVVYKHPTLTAEQLQQAQLDAHRHFYTFGKFIKHVLTGDIGNAVIVLYARHLQAKWVDDNSYYMKVLKLLTPSDDFQITLDLRKPVIIG